MELHKVKTKVARIVAKVSALHVVVQEMKAEGFDRPNGNGKKHEPEEDDHEKEPSPNPPSDSSRSEP